MRKLLTFVAPGVSISATGIGLFGYIEVPWTGGQIMMGGHPIDSFFIEAGSLALILFGGTTGTALVISYTRDLIKWLRETAVREFDEIQRCGQEMMHWANDNMENPSRAIPPSQTNLRWIVLSKKYRRWLKNPAPGRPASVLDLANDAAGCAETLRAYGYIRGRIRICKEVRDWNQSIAA